MDRHFLWGLKAEPHFVMANVHHCHEDVLTDDDALILLRLRTNTSLPQCPAGEIQRAKEWLSCQPSQAENPTRYPSIEHAARLW